MTPQQPRISVIDPISPAIDKVKEILFRPFDLGKWFVIGFCAWLATLGEGGANFNFNFRGGFGQPGTLPFHEARDFFMANLAWIIPLIVTFVVFCIVLGLVICWLSSRGQFMFLHCVAQNKAEVKVPWHKYRRQGNSLFIFRIVVGIISFVFFALLAGIVALVVVVLTKSHAGPSVAVIVSLAFLAFLIIVPVAIAFALLLKFTGDFVVPVMYLRGLTCTDAWREFWSLLSANKGKFTLYILFQIVIGMAIGAIVLAVALVTCCCAAVIMAIPYIGTVFLLPILVFQRSYSLCYFRQFGPAFDVFSPEVAEPELLEGS